MFGSTSGPIFTLSRPISGSLPTAVRVCARLFAVRSVEAWRERSICLVVSQTPPSHPLIEQNSQFPRPALRLDSVQKSPRRLRSGSSELTHGHGRQGHGTDEFMGAAQTQFVVLLLVLHSKAACLKDVVRNNFPYLHRRIWAHSVLRLGGCRTFK